ncbi:MAG TPA: PD-(D/E)XK nuclease family protein [Dehalococcoidia bacterium]|nr:PD-(D/E)XK nuclease family protein [Dehalococcoidia bacterium]
MFKVSPERLRTFRRCRLRYRYQYVDRLPGRASQADALGALVHAALHDFFRYVPPSERDEERLITVLDEKWQALARRPAGGESLRERAEGQLRLFAREENLSVQPLALESPFQVPLSEGVALVGRVDRVDQESDGGLHIIDYKTGPRPEEPDVEQLHLYAIMVARTLSGPLRRASYYYLELGDVLSISPDRQELEGVAQRALAAAEEMVAETEYPATVGRHCAGCPYLYLCAERDRIAQVRQEEGW